MLALALALAAVSLPARSAPLSYAVQAEIADDGAQIRGTATIRYLNDGDSDLDHLVLLLYPTRFRTEEEALNDLTRGRVFPGPFSAGDMVLEGVDTEPVVFELAPAGSYERLVLSAPLPPGEEAVVELSFVTTIPHRFGSFGRHAWMVALNGGWSPMVAARDAGGGWDLEAPPPLADWEIDLSYGEGWSAVVNGLVQETSDGVGASGRGEALFQPGRARVWTEGRFASVVLHRRGQVTIVDTPEGPVTYVGLPPNKSQREDMAATVETARRGARSWSRFPCAGGCWSRARAASWSPIGTSTPNPWSVVSPRPSSPAR